jgi:excinuclease ABC subunit B
MSKEKLQKLIAKTKKSMEVAVKELDFLEAARLRDELLSLQEFLESR